MNKKKKPQTGSIAHNFYQGTRSEYLAQYVFSAFGTSIPVPHPEDSGIDLYCTLGEVIGKLLNVTNYFLVQVKSNNKDIIYDNQVSVNWLISHKYPFLICHIDKNIGNVKIYQTTLISGFHKGDEINKIVLRFNQNNLNSEKIEENGNYIINLEPPILNFNINDLGNKENVLNYRKILKAWIELDQENIDKRVLGLKYSLFPKIIEPNKVPDFPMELKVNFLDINKNKMQREKYNNQLFAILADELFRLAKENKKELFINLTQNIVELLKQKELKGSYGIVILQTAINKGNELLGIKGILKLNNEDGTVYSDTKNIKIIKKLEK